MRLYSELEKYLLCREVTFDYNLRLLKIHYMTKLIPIVIRGNILLKYVVLELTLHFTFATVFSISRII